MIPPRGFPDTEYAARTHSAQARMAPLGLDAVLLTTQADVQYFTGFQTLFWQSPTRPWFVIIPATGKPIAIIPEIGANLMRGTWLDDIRAWAAPTPSDDGITLLTEALLPFKTLGVMKGHETRLRMPLGDWERLLVALPDLSVKDATPLIQSLRMVKSEAEIAKLSHICAIGSATFAAVPKFARVGTPLDAVFRDFRRDALAQGADNAPYLVGAASQGGYADVISPPDATPLAAGDILMLDTGLIWDGYHCDFDRNWAIGQASDAARRAYDVLWRATEAGIGSARPGQTARDVCNAMSAVIAEMDTSGGGIGRLGHGVGLQLTEQPSLATFDVTPLAENMVLTLEPSLSYGDGLIMVHEENIVITSAGGRLLTTRAPDELPVLHL